MNPKIPRFLSMAIWLCCLFVLSTASHASLIVMTNNDAAGATTSFNGNGKWIVVAPPAIGNMYATGTTNMMRTPNNASSFTFQGDSLTLNGPGTTAAGGGRIDLSGGTGGIITVTNLVATNLAMIQHGGSSGQTIVLAGGLTIQADAVNQSNTNGCVFLTGNGPILLTANLSGAGAICLGTPSAGNNDNPLILAGDLSQFTGKIITTDHHVRCPIVISNATDQTMPNVISLLDSFTKRGPGKLTLTGTNNYAGVTTNNSGTLVLAGNEAGVTNATVVLSGATLQLQANSTNIASGVSYALGTSNAAVNLFNAGSIIQFRSDSSVTFNGGDNLGGVGNGISTWDVNQLTGAGVNNTVTFGAAGFNVLNSTFNFTGGNGYSLALGALNLINTGGTLTLNASNVNVTVNGITSAGASGVTTIQGGSNVTISAAITANTALTKQGTGLLTLNGANTYTGNTLVQTGTVLLANGTTLASTNLNISAGATLDVRALSGSILALNGGQVLAGKGTVNGSVDTSGGGLIFPGANLVAGTLSVTTNLTLSAGGTLSFDLAHNTAIGGGSNDLIVVAGNLNVAGSTTLALNFLNGSPATGVYTLIQYGTYAGDYTQISLPSNPRYSLVLSNDTVHKAIELIVSGVAGNLVWVGDGSGNGWDNAGGYQNWTNTGSASLDFFYDGDNVTFNDSGSASPAINLTAVNSPGSLTVNATQSYDFAGGGGISGVASLVKGGSGTLILETANSYTGPTVINGGKVQIGNVNASGSLGAGAVTNNGTLSFDRIDGIGVANDIHGTGTLSLDGSGSVTLTSANNDYSGSTLINSGIFFMANSTALGATSAGTTVAPNAQLYITANVNVGPEPLTLAGVGDGNGALRKGGAGVTTYGGALTLNSNTTITIDGNATLILTNSAGIIGASNALTVAGNGTLTIGGPVKLGTNSLTVSGGGTLNLNSSNNYSGGTFLNFGIINANSNGVFGTGGIECNSGSSVGRIVLGTGTTLTNSVLADTVAPGAATGLLMVGDNTNGTITTISGPIAFNATAANGGHLVGPTTSGYLNVSGPISMPASAPMIIRFGFLRFSGGGNYSEIQVRANTSSIGANNGVATNAVMDIGGNGSPTVPTYFDLNGFNQQLAGLKNTVTAANLGVVTNSGATVKTLTLDLAGNSYSFSGAVAGNVALVLNSGTENFTGTNTYTGNTTINGGTLELATPSITSNTTVTIASGAFLQLDFATTNTVGALVLAGSSQLPGVYNSTTSPSFIAGPGSLLVVPPVNSNPTNIIAKVNGGNLELSWPADHTGWRLQVQTNALATGLNTNWVDVPNATAGNSVTNAINAINGAVFYRMIYP